MKQCITCKIEKEENEFAWRVENIKQHNQCRACHKEYRRRHYLGNQEKYKNKARKWEKENGRCISQAKIYAYEFLLKSKCIDCGENDPSILEFDHKEPAKKAFTISQKLWVSLDLIKQEIEKCEIRCRNCHGKRTVKMRGGFYKWYDKIPDHKKHLV